MDDFHGAFHFAFFIGIFDTQVKNAAALMRDAFVGERHVQISEMHETRGRRRDTRNFGAFFQRARRINFIVFLYRQ